VKNFDDVAKMSEILQCY